MSLCRLLKIKIEFGGILHDLKDIQRTKRIIQLHRI